MSIRTEVLLWAQRVMFKKGGPAHALLELSAGATPEQAQEAFHKIARMAHPDLHRTGLNADELELVTSAYALVAGAYQTLRTQPMPTQSIPVQPVRTQLIPTQPVRTQQLPTQPVRTQQLPTEPVRTQQIARPAVVEPIAASPVPATATGPAPSPTASQTMSPKALAYYRKAEVCLKRGDLKGAILQIKLACAADPSSAFLRTALAEIQAEMRKG